MELCPVFGLLSYGEPLLYAEPHREEALALGSREDTAEAFTNPRDPELGKVAEGRFLNQVGKELLALRERDPSRGGGGLLGELIIPEDVNAGREGEFAVGREILLGVDGLIGLLRPVRGDAGLGYPLPFLKGLGPVPLRDMGHTSPAR